MIDLVFLESRLLHLKSRRKAVVESLVEYGKSMPKAHSIYKVTKMLPSIEAAIKKIETNRETYGICEGCGCEIPDARLRIFPEANLCIKCQDLEEKKLNVQ